MTFRLYYYFVNAFGIYTQKSRRQLLVMSQFLSLTLMTQKTRVTLNENMGRVIWVIRVIRVKRGELRGTESC